MFFPPPWTIDILIGCQPLGHNPSKLQVLGREDLSPLTRVATTGPSILVDRDQQDLVEGAGQVTEQGEPVGVSVGGDNHPSPTLNMAFSTGNQTLRHVQWGQ